MATRFSFTALTKVGRCSGYSLRGILRKDKQGLGLKSTTAFNFPCKSDLKSRGAMMRHFDSFTVDKLLDQNEQGCAGNKKTYVNDDRG